MTVVWIRPRFAIEMRRLQIVSEHIGEKLHTTICMMDDEPLARSQKLVRNDKRSYGVITGAPTRIANDVSITFR